MSKRNSFGNVTIIGVGLMGGSLGMALRAHELADWVIGVEPGRLKLAEASDHGAIDAGVTDIAEGVRNADWVFIATPLAAMPAILDSLAETLPPAAIVTDLGSVKAGVVQIGERLFGERFLGGHPMAGSERGGVGSARADLFTDAAWAIVRSYPFTFEKDESAARLAAFAEALGARPIALDAARHDALTALVSHLPHLLSFAFARTIKAHPETEIAQLLAGGSYRDLIRVSRSDTTLWRDILLENRDALALVLTEYERHLADLRDALRLENAEALEALLRGE